MSKTTKSIIQIIILFLGLLFLLWRAPFGFSFYDEPFIISLGQRLSYGDSLIVDEWHLTQFFAPVTMFFYKLFHMFSHTNEGIVVSFRYFYSVLWFLTSYSVYRVLRYKYSYAIIVYIFLMLFAPFDYMSISYKSVGLMCGLLLSCIIYYSSQKSVSNKFLTIWISVLSFLFSCCIPFVSIVYVIALFTILIYNNRKERDAIWHSKQIIICLLLTTVFALLYLNFFVFKQYSLIKVFDTVHFLFDDPEHSFTFMNRVNYIYWKVIYKLLHKSLTGSYILLTAVAFSLINIKSKKYKLYIYIYACIGYLISITTYARSDLNWSFNYEILDISLLGIVAFILLERKPWELFFSFSTIGFFLIIADCFFSSNTGLFELGADSLLFGVSSIVYHVEVFKECVKNDSYYRRKILVVFCSIILVTQLSVQLYTRLHRQFMDTAINKMTSTIEVGANKGLKTTMKRKESYTMYYNNLKQLLNNAKVHKNQRFLSLSSDPVIYLDAEMQFGTFSTWTFGYTKQSLIKRYSDYYTNVPEMNPEVIFAETENNIIKITDYERYRKYKYNGSVLFVKREKVLSNY